MKNGRPVFSKIYDCLKANANKKSAITVRKLMEFLLGVSIRQSSIYEDSEYSKWYRGKRDIPMAIKMNVVNKLEWRIDKCFVFCFDNDAMKNIQHELRNVCKANFKEPFEERHLSYVIGCLVRWELFGAYEFGKIRIEENDLVMSSNFIGRTHDLNNLKEMFSVEDIIVLYGIRGIGKSWLAKKFLDLNIKEGKEGIYCTYRKNLRETICGIWNIVTINEEGRELSEEELYKRNVGFLKRMPSDFMLVIDSYIWEDLKSENEMRILAELSIKVLIVTRYVVKNRAVSNYRLEGLGDEAWKIAFEKEKVDVDADSIKKISEIVDDNTLVMKLIMKALKKSKINAKDLAKKMEQKGTEELRASGLRVKASFDKEDLTVYGHIAKLIDIYDEPVKLVEYGKIACFAKTKISKKFLQRWAEINEEKKYIDDCVMNLLQQGWAEADDSGDYFEMNSLARNVIIQKSKVRYRDIRCDLPRIQKDISKADNITWGEMVTIQDMVYNLFEQFGNEVKPYNNRNQKVPSKEMREWWQFGEDCIEFFLEQGDSFHVKKIIEMLYIVKGKDIGDEKQRLSKKIYEFRFRWVEGNQQNVNEKINDILELFDRMREADSFSKETEWNFYKMIMDWLVMVDLHQLEEDDFCMKIKWNIYYMGVRMSRLFNKGEDEVIDAWCRYYAGIILFVCYHDKKGWYAMKKECSYFYLKGMEKETAEMLINIVAFGVKYHILGIYDISIEEALDNDYKMMLLLFREKRSCSMRMVMAYGIASMMYFGYKREKNAVVFVIEECQKLLDQQLRFYNSDYLTQMNDAISEMRAQLLEF